MFLSLFIPVAKAHIVELEIHIKSIILLFQDNEKIALHNADNKITWEFLFFYDVKLRNWFSSYLGPVAALGG